MKEMKILPPSEWTENPFTLIGKEWMLVAAEKDGRVNAMTAAWGGLDVYKRQAYAWFWAECLPFTWLRRSGRN